MLSDSAVSWLFASREYACYYYSLLKQSHNSSPLLSTPTSSTPTSPPPPAKSSPTSPTAISSNPPPKATSLPPLSSAPHPPAGHVPRVEETLTSPLVILNHTTTATTPSPTSPATLSDIATYHSKTRNPGQRRRQAKRAAKLANTHECTTDTETPPPISFPIPTTHSHVTQSTTGHLPRANCVVATSALPLLNSPQLLIVDDPTAHFANVVIDPATGASLEYPALLRGPDAAKWEHGTSLELGRLTKRYLPYTTRGSETMVFIRHADKPHDRVATYLRIVTALKPNKADMYRIRFTCSGDKIIYAGEVSTPTADLTTVKTHLNSVVSTPDAK